MVNARLLQFPMQPFFQYSLCRVVLMVLYSSASYPSFAVLSVLALSSRFDGPDDQVEDPVVFTLSVLALSSRFDGRSTRRPGLVLVLRLSVLALSSRFDGLILEMLVCVVLSTFSTRSVESF